jgi:hypothetical protein
MTMGGGIENRRRYLADVPFSLLIDELEGGLSDIEADEMAEDVDGLFLRAFLGS